MSRVPANSWPCPGPMSAKRPMPRLPRRRSGDRHARAAVAAWSLWQPSQAPLMLAVRRPPGWRTVCARREPGSHIIAPSRRSTPPSTSGRSRVQKRDRAGRDPDEARIRRWSMAISPDRQRPRHSPACPEDTPLAKSASAQHGRSRRTPQIPISCARGPRVRSWAAFGRRPITGGNVAAGRHPKPFTISVRTTPCPAARNRTSTIS